jgi:ABC-type nitrate/sulfonate/bicarbonate transport system substrate-binding protein
MQPTLLPVKDPLETVTLIFEFGPHLNHGATVFSAVASVSTFTGIDPNPGAVLLMDPDWLSQAPNVLQRVTGGVEAATYEVVVSATTSDGEILVLKGILPVGS